MSKFILLLIFLSVKVSFSQATSECFSCVKVIYIIDNSTSISTFEYADMRNSVNQISNNILTNYNDVEIAIVQYKHDGFVTPQYQVSVPFTSSIPVSQAWTRMTIPGAQDHLPGSLNVMRNAGIWNAGGQLDLVTGGCEIRFFVFTDAFYESISGCCSDLFNGTVTIGSVPAGTLNGFGEYDFLKVNYGAVFTVYHVPPDVNSATAGAAISSVGGLYNGPIAPNPTDPEGSGVLPRRYQPGTSFALTPAQINNIVLSIDPQGGAISIDLSDSIHLKDSVCVGENAYFFSNGDTASYDSFVWDFGDGNYDSTNVNATHVYAAPGIYTVTHIVTIDTCTDTATQQIEVISFPIADFTIDSVCIGVPNILVNNSGGSYTSSFWDFGDGNTGNNNTLSFTHTYSNVGNYAVKLVSNNLGCKDSTTRQTLVEDAPRPSFTFTNPCQFESFQITNLSQTATGGSSQNFIWDWSFGDGRTSTVKDPALAYPIEGTYNIRLGATSLNGCFKDTTVRVTVHPKPNADFYSDSVCFGLITQITDNSSVASGTIAAWEYLLEGVTYTIQNPMHQYATDGMFPARQIVTSNHGCKDTAYDNIIVHPLPVVDFDNSPEDLDVFRSYRCFTNLTTGAVNYFWDFDFDNQTSTDVDPCITFPQLGDEIYNTKLIAITQYGCIDSITKPIEVRTSFFIYAPNAFTPDGDGVNETFLPAYSQSAIREVELYIFNRWGEKLFETNEMDKAWDGTFRGVKCKQDVYVYRIFGTDIYGNKHEKYGHINLLR